MPVLSPHRSSGSGLSGSYRSSTPLYTPRIYTESSTPLYTPRIYTERYTSRTFIDYDGRRVFSRSASITEDGVTTRFREESREGSLRRDSASRDSGISSIRENSVLDYPRRDSSLGRNEKLSTASVIDSVAELRNKYSPANYVPAIYRNKYENISRSKSINDIGLPPLEKSGSASASSKKKQVNSDSVASPPVPTHNSNNSNQQSVSACSNTNLSADNCPNEDDNGNRRASVADLCRKFDEKSTRTVKPKLIIKKKLTEGGDLKGGREANAASISAGVDPDALSNGTASTLTNGFSGTAEENHANDVATQSLQPKSDLVNGIDDGDDKIDGVEPSAARRSARVNQCASYISSKDDDNLDSKEEGVVKNDSYSKLANDLTASSGARGGGRAAPSPGLSRRSILAPTDGGDDDDVSADSLDRRRVTSNDMRPTLGLIGLRNIGNTCFMNSVIQCLSNTKPLLEYVRKESYLRDVNTTTSSMKGALIKAFAEVIRELWSGESSERAVNTVSLKSQIQRFAPRFIGYAQQDAQEFLRYLLEGLHEDVNRVTTKPRPLQTDIDDSLPDAEKAAEAWKRYLRVDNSFIVDVFVGQLKSTLKCTHCGHCSVTFDPFWDLSLPLPPRSVGNTVRLSHCLDAFAKEETLDGDEKPTCAKCKERRKCTKSFAIQKFPQTLVIHLKRFSPMERFRGKLNTLVEFPLDGLDLSHYAAEPGGQVSPRYTLYAVSNHSGTSISGHYTAYCRHPYDLRWHEYNDSRVTSASARSVVSPEAYVLFYEREGTQRSHL